MKFYISFAIAALINNSSAIQFKAQEQESVETLNELNRYIGSDGKPINLAQTTGHARLSLTKIKKVSHKPEDNTLIFGDDENNDCPINKGEKVTTHIEQKNLQDNAYTSELYVGNPPQKIRALFDTGSTNTWILNKETNIEGSKTLSYDDKASTTSKKTDQKAHISFGSGSLQGTFFNDDIRIGTCDGKSGEGQIHIKNQKFGNVEQQKTIFTGDNFEAIIGLAYPALAERNTVPVFDEMMGQHLLKDNIFAFYLTNLAQESEGKKSDLTFGYYDKTKFTGDISWNPVDYKYMYGVPFDDISVAGKKLNLCDNLKFKCLVTFDSGTSLMSMPQQATAILSQIGVPSAQHIKKCQSHQQFGDFVYHIGGQDYKLENEEWMFPAKNIEMNQLAQGGITKIKFEYPGPLGPQLLAQVDNDHFMQQEQPVSGDFDLLQAAADINADIKAGKKTQSVKACASGIMSMDISHQMFLVGDIFMRKFYTIFDRDNDKVGLALAI